MRIRPQSGGCRESVAGRDAGSDCAGPTVSARHHGPVPTDLTQWMASLDAAGLERVALLRPDVVLGAPVRDVPDLADRLEHPASVASVVRELPLPAVQVLEVLQAMGAGASTDGAAALLDAGPRTPQEHLDAVTGFVGHLVECALVWPDGTGRLRLNPGLLAVIDEPLGLGWPAALLVPEISAPELQKVARRWGLDVPKRKGELVEAVLGVLGDAASVRRLVGEAPEPVAGVLLDHARDAARRWTEPDAPAADDAVPRYLRGPAAFGRHRVAATWALENGLAFGPRYDVSSVRMPSEVLLALVDPAARVRFDPVRPVVPTAPVAPGQVAAAASGAVTELLGSVMATLEHLSRTPAAALKVGGVGAREIGKLAKAVGAAPVDVRFALELALHVDLLAAAGPGRLGVAEAFADWRRLGPARRVADLVQAWAGMRYAPTVDRAPDGTSVPALSRVDDGDAALTAGVDLTAAARSKLAEADNRFPAAEVRGVAPRRGCSSTSAISSPTRARRSGSWKCSTASSAGIHCISSASSPTSPTSASTSDFGSWNRPQSRSSVKVRMRAASSARSPWPRSSVSVTAASLVPVSLRGQTRFDELPRLRAGHAPSARSFVLPWGRSCRFFGGAVARSPRCVTVTRQSWSGVWPSTS